tara:strand:+ start:210 stop:1127 length:918 start_codon:yes stop_codon:yes gene_type:complete
MPEFNRDKCFMQGRRLDPLLLEDLTRSSLSESIKELQVRFASEQYLYLKKVFSRDEIDAVRSEVFTRLHAVGEIESAGPEGIFTGESRRGEVPEGLGEFWRSVSQGPALRKISHGTQITKLISQLFAEPYVAHDYLFLRPAVPGRSTHLHYDHPFFARGSEKIVTAWTAYGDIPVDEGPLLVVDQSYEFTDLVEATKNVDYESNETPLVQIMQDPSELARTRGVKLKTADFEAGDVILFSMTLLHGSLDNRSERGRVRLSSDVRWQPSIDPVDPRYVGDNPPGTTGAGYGELNGAKPLTIGWHQR